MDGRIVANAGFLRALLRRSPFRRHVFALVNREQCRILREFLEAEGLFSDAVHLATRDALPALLREGGFHCAHLSDCVTSLAALARLRRLAGQAGGADGCFPVTAGVHSMSYGRYASRLLELCWPGATGREAVVATSLAGRRMLEAAFAWLAEGYGPPGPPPRLETIPLGVDPGLFPPPSPEARRAARIALGLPADRVTFLLFGRLSPGDKFDIPPVLRALQRALREDGAPGSAGSAKIAGSAGTDRLEPSRVSVVLAGWVEGDGGHAHHLRALAANLGVHAALHARPDAAARTALFQAADCLVSPADNIQEMFGLTLLEAGLAGLPVLAADYDGYRDIVIHEETGLLVPTLGFPDDPLADALAPLLPEELTHLRLAQQTVVDVPAMAQALRRLGTDAALRRRLGEAARARVLAGFTWDHVVDRHLALWQELWDVPVTTLDQPHPLQYPHARLFAGHPRQALAPAAMLRRSRLGEAVLRGRDHPQFHAGLEAFLEPEALRRLLVLARHPQSAGELLARLEQEDRDGGSRFRLHWCLKHDLLERAED